MTTLVILTSLVNTNVNVHAATHTHSFNFTAIEETLAGYNSSGHIIKGTIYYVCDCGASEVDIQYKTDAHNKTHTDFHRGTQHTFGDSCWCGWSNITTYSCPGGNGGICITPYSGISIE